jgi:hypothetical protein
LLAILHGGGARKTISSTTTTKAVSLVSSQPIEHPCDSIPYRYTTTHLQKLGSTAFNEETKLDKQSCERDKSNVWQFMKNISYNFLETTV